MKLRLLYVVGVLVLGVVNTAFARAILVRDHPGQCQMFELYHCHCVTVITVANCELGKDSSCDWSPWCAES